MPSTDTEDGLVSTPIIRRGFSPNSRYCHYTIVLESGAVVKVEVTRTGNDNTYPFTKVKIY